MQNLKKILAKTKSVMRNTPRYVLVTLCVTLLVTSSGIIAWRKFRDSKAPTCNTAVITLNGELVEYKSAEKDTWTDEAISSEIVDSLESAESDPNIKAVVLLVNTPGGSPIGGQRIADALKRIHKPTVALIGEQGTSSGYLISTGADRIFASTLSDVGSIGVIQEVYDQTAKDKDDGYSVYVLSSTPGKAVGNPHIPFTEEDKKSFMSGIMQMHEIFIDEVAKNRDMNRDFVAHLADGSSMLGTDALNVGLIDEIGDMYDVRQYLSYRIGTPVTTCEY